jgi:hypothetical protein
MATDALLRRSDLVEYVGGADQRIVSDIFSIRTFRPECANRRVCFREKMRADKISEK